MVCRSTSLATYNTVSASCSSTRRGYVMPLSVLKTVGSQAAIPFVHGGCHDGLHRCCKEGRQRICRGSRFCSPDGYDQVRFMTDLPSLVHAVRWAQADAASALSNTLADSTPERPVDDRSIVLLRSHVHVLVPFLSGLMRSDALLARGLTVAHPYSGALGRCFALFRSSPPFVRSGDSLPRCSHLLVLVNASLDYCREDDSAPHVIRAFHGGISTSCPFRSFSPWSCSTCARLGRKSKCRRRCRSVYASSRRCS